MITYMGMTMPMAAFAEYDYPYAGDSYGVDFDQASTVFEEGDVIALFGDSITHSGKFIRELYEHYLNSDVEMGRLEMYNVGIFYFTASPK